jgi:integrase
MWIEKRGQQHRAYWRKPADGKDYEAFDTKTAAQDFIGLCNKFGRDKVVARHRANGQAATVVAPSTTPGAAGAPGGHTIAVPALAAGLTAPTPAGITLAWLGEQYASSGNRGNANTRSDYRRDLDRYVYPYFGRGSAGDVDLAMIMTRPLPTLDGADWPWPTIAGWKTWLGEQPRHDRHGKPIPASLLADKTRRNIESLLSQVFNFALAFDPLPLLNRNPCTPLGLIRPEPEECVWLEFIAAALLLKHIDPWYVLLVTFLLATGIRWGEAAALQVKDFHLGDGTEADPPWVYVHKTWKRIGACGDRTKAGSRKPRKGAKFLWGRRRTKTVAGRRRITLTQGIRAELLPLLAGRDPHAPVFEDAATSHRTPASVNARYRPNPVGPASYAAAHGPGKSRTQPITSSRAGVSRARNTSPVTPSIAAATTDLACTSSPTLVRSENTGASHTCRIGRARELALGNPRECVSEAPADNHLTRRSLHTV